MQVGENFAVENSLGTALICPKARISAPPGQIARPNRARLSFQIERPRHTRAERRERKKERGAPSGRAMAERRKQKKNAAPKRAAKIMIGESTAPLSGS